MWRLPHVALHVPEVNPVHLLEPYSDILLFLKEDTAWSRSMQTRWTVSRLTKAGPGFSGLLQLEA